MRLLCLTAALLTLAAAGCSKETAYKPANAPAAADEKPLNASPPGGDKMRSRPMGGMQTGK